MYIYITIVLWITEGVGRLHEKFCAVGTKTNQVVIYGMGKTDSALQLPYTLKIAPIIKEISRFPRDFY